MLENVLININKIGVSIDDVISFKLLESKLPKCFGKCYPDVVSLDQQFDLNEISEHKQEGIGSNINMIEVMSVASINTYQDRVITEKGIIQIEDRKSRIAGEYVSQLVACSECKHFDRCSELTKNYAQAVNINLLLKLKNI